MHRDGKIVQKISINCQHLDPAVLDKLLGA